MACGLGSDLVRLLCNLIMCPMCARGCLQIGWFRLVEHKLLNEFKAVFAVNSCPMDARGLGRCSVAL